MIAAQAQQAMNKFAKRKEAELMAHASYLNLSVVVLVVVVVVVVAVTPLTFFPRKIPFV